MSEASDDLFERVGGAAVVEAVVRGLYDRVLADPELRPYFDGVEIERLQRMQFQFSAAALGGPTVYSGQELRKAHGKLGVTDAAFAKFCGHYADELEARGVSAKDVNDVMGRLSLFKESIVGDANVDG